MDGQMDRHYARERRTDNSDFIGHSVGRGTKKKT